MTNDESATVEDCIDLQDIIETIESEGWTVETVVSRFGDGEVLSADLTIEYTNFFDLDFTSEEGRDIHRAVKEIIEQTEEHQKPKTETVVNNIVNTTGLNRKEALESLRVLKDRGEIYEPTTDTLRTT